jgi:hypothetical protein
MPHGLTSLWNDLAAKPAEHFPNHLVDPPGAVSLPRRGWLLVALVLCCLAMRLWMACRWQILWPDAVDYFHVSQSLERGNVYPLVSQFGLNIYPPILVLLNRAGLEWETAGQWWSLAMASLSVLPLFGWLRRQFDDQVALVACLLYAIHPKLLIYSPLAIRDPMFWFLLLLTLYWGWRAVVEVRIGLFCAAGIACALAVHTRTEGWLLLAPLGLWVMFRWPAVAGCRLRLVLGGLLWLVMVAAWIVLMNVTLLHGDPHWMLLRSDHIEMLHASWPGRTPHLFGADETPEAVAAAEEEEAEPGQAPGSPRKATPPPHFAGPVPRPLHLGVAAAKMAERLVKGFTYIYLLLGLLGIWFWRRVFFRRDQLAMVPFNLLLWLLIGVRYTEGLGIDIRYFFPSVMASLGFAALALLAIVQWLTQTTAARVAWSPPRRAALCCVLLACIVLAGTPDRSLSERQFMLQHAELGKWILNRYGPRLRLAGQPPEMRLVGYYARTRPVPYADRYSYAVGDLPETILACRPDVLLLWGEPSDAVSWQRVLNQHAELHLRRISPQQLPPSCQGEEGLVIAVRRELAGKAEGLGIGD